MSLSLKPVNKNLLGGKQLTKIEFMFKLIRVT